MKPCTDGVSTDIRPPFNLNLQLKEFLTENNPDFKIEVVTPAVAIIYFPSSPKWTKVTVYLSGRMLIDSRDKSLVTNIVSRLLDTFRMKNETIG